MSRWGLGALAPLSWMSSCRYRLGITARCCYQAIAEPLALLVSASLGVASPPSRKPFVKSFTRTAKEPEDHGGLWGFSGGALIGNVVRPLHQRFLARLTPTPGDTSLAREQVIRRARIVSGHPLQHPIERNFRVVRIAALAGFD